MPDISVLMSAYNGEEFINESIDSILNQTFEDFEFIIINDASTDKTRHIIESYRDPRIKIINITRNCGVGAALRIGLAQAEGKYIAKQDADDISENKRLEKQKAFLDNYPEVSVVKTLIKYFPHTEEVQKSKRYEHFISVMENEQNSVVCSEEIKEKLYWYNCVTHATIMARSEALKRFGYTELRIAEDYKLFYDLNKHGYKFATLNEVLVRVRVSKTSVTAMDLDSYFPIIFEQIKKDEIMKLFNNNRVLIWGAGGYGQKVLDIFNKNGLDAEGFIDSNFAKQKGLVNGKKVYSPKLLKEKVKDIKIVVASGGKLEIAQYLKELGYEHLNDFIIYS